MSNLLRNRRGVALLMAIGILAIMSIIATSFALNMKLELEAALNYLRSAKALYLAESGINKVISDIRSQVPTSTYSGVIAYVSGYDTTTEWSIDSIGTYQVVTIGSPVSKGGEDQKVNLNALDETDSIWIGTLQTAGLTYNDIAEIIDYRDSDTNAITQLCTSTGVQSALGDETNTKNAPYVSLEEVKLVIGDTKYESIKNYITIFAPIIRGGLIGEYFVNRTSFSSSTILDLSNYKGKVIELGKMKEPTGVFDTGEGVWKPWGTIPGADGDSSADGVYDGWAEGHDAAFAGGYLAVDWNVGFGLDQFGVIWSGFIYIPEDKVGQSITFYQRSDDGMRLYIDGQLIISDWNDSGMEASPGVSGSRTFTYAGWHPIRIEYYENWFFNGFELRWDALGSINYVLAEYYGYYPAPYFGRYQPPTFPPATPDIYNSAGFYKITSTGRVKTADGAILAEKKITAVAKIFGTWAQTTRAEFYAAWFSEYGTGTDQDLSDGGVKNVNWMDSCPKNASADLEAGGYETVTDSLKLGYWDNFDEDVAYSVVNLRGDAIAEITGGGIGWQSWAPWTTWNVSFGEFGNYEASDADNEFKIDAAAKKEVRARLNENYYYSNASSLYDLFLRAWEKDKDGPTERRTNPAVDGGGNPLPALYEPSWMVGLLYAKGPIFDINTPWSGPEPWAYRTLLLDGDNDIFGDDKYEVNLADLASVGETYQKTKVLSLIGVGSTYQGFINGAPKLSNSTGDPSKEGVVKMMMWNIQYPGWPAWTDAITNRLGNYWDGTLHYYGCGTANEIYFDNIRFIPKRGYFVSTPFASSLNSNPSWGTISWSYESVPNTSITMSVRAGDSLATTDTGWGSVSNGSALSVTGKQIQYKAELSTNALNTADYSGSGVTPILKDVTITYLPQVEILFWREETR